MLLNNLLYLYGALKSNYVHNYLHMFIYVGHNVDCVTTGGQVSLTNKIFVIDIEFYMKK